MKNLPCSTTHFPREIVSKFDFSKTSEEKKALKEAKANKRANAKRQVLYYLGGNKPSLDFSLRVS